MFKDYVPEQFSLAYPLVCPAKHLMSRKIPVEVLLYLVHPLLLPSLVLK